MLGQFAVQIGELRCVAIFSIQAVRQSLIQIENERLGLPGLLWCGQVNEVEPLDCSICQIVRQLV